MSDETADILGWLFVLVVFACGGGLGFLLGYARGLKAAAGQSQQTLVNFDRVRARHVD